MDRQPEIAADPVVHQGGVEQVGVFVHTVPVAAGRSVTYQVVGDLDPLSVPVLLELAIKVARNNLGLEP